MITDNDADGFYYGNDNVYVQIKPDGELRNVRMHMSSDNRWPYFDNEHKVLKMEEVQYASSSEEDVQTIELRIPGREDIGLELNEGSVVGLMFYVNIPDRGQISVFEPYHIFDSVLR